MIEQIAQLFKQGLSNREIAIELQKTDDVICKMVKKLALVRTEQQKTEIKSRSQMGKAYQKPNPNKYKPELAASYGWSATNYMTDDIRKGLINTGNLENDIEISLNSFQKLKDARRKNTIEDVPSEEGEEDFAL